MTDVVDTPADGLTALGTNVYLPGMGLGAWRTGFADGGSRESYKLAIRGRRALGQADCQRCERADLVYGNPPCSRYSSQSASAYSPSARSDIETFKELLEVLDAARDVGARAVWWETGPLIWGEKYGGREMIADAHHALDALWQAEHGGCTTLVVRTDGRITGIPQRRPRVHTIHAAGRIPVEEIPLVAARPWSRATAPFAFDVIWARMQREGYDDPGPLHSLASVPGRKTASMPPSEAVPLAKSICKFVAGWPKFASVRDPWLPSLNRRPVGWKELDRWVGVGEWAAAMGYPQAWGRTLAEKLSIGDAMTLMAKCVSPSTSEAVCREAVLPMLLKAGRRDGERGRVYFRDATELIRDSSMPRNRFDEERVPV